MCDHMCIVAPDGLWTGLLAPQTVASVRASRRPDEPLDRPSGTPDGGLCTGFLPPRKRTSENEKAKTILNSSFTFKCFESIFRFCSLYAFRCTFAEGKEVCTEDRVWGARRPVQRFVWAPGGLCRGHRLGPQEARPEAGLQVMQNLSVGTVEGKNICALFGVVRGRSRKI